MLGGVIYFTSKIASFFVFTLISGVYGTMLTS